MIRKILNCATVPVLLCVVGTGCARHHKERIALLEQVNRNLTERVNALGADLDAAKRDGEGLNRRLEKSAGNLAAMQSELSARPTAREAAPGWTPVPGGAMIAIEGSVLFAPGKIAVRKEARRTLDAVVSTLQGEYGDKDVLVIGHTDNAPIKKSGWLDNYQLSTERALAVVRYLRDHGVSAKRLIASGCGENRPRVANTTNANRASNRRVEILATTPLPITTEP